MKISFVIPAYNEAVGIGDCLSSILKEIERTGYDAEIIVANNASTDNTKQVASSFPGVKVVDEPRKGIVWARRAGYVASSGDLIANLDADTRLIPGWLDRVKKEFSQDPQLVALTGPFVIYDMGRAVKFLTRIFYLFTFLVYVLNRYILRLGSFIQGGNFVIARRALDQIGGYDTSIEFYGEDADLARRLHAVGNVKFTTQLPVYSSGRRLAAEGLFAVSWRYTVNYFSVMFFKKPSTMTSTDVRIKK